MSEASEELVPSELGTKEFWDKTYFKELDNFKDHGDVGEVWFGEDAVLKIVRWLGDKVTKDSKIVDLGCGNGMLLVELAREGFTQLMGVDYSQPALDLAQAVAQAQGLNIVYCVADLLSEKILDKNIGFFSVAMDKGTYDAISLNPKGGRETYIENVWQYLQPSGLLIITSCNWSQQELLSHFHGRFKLMETIPTPTFQFGGKVGNLITMLVLQRVEH